jgi:hypothetical protein
LSQYVPVKNRALIDPDREKIDVERSAKPSDEIQAARARREPVGRQGARSA